MIRWITDQIGTAPFDSTSPQKDVYILDVRDLVDKTGNITTTIKEKIEQGMLMLGQGQKVVVCCDYGISRSNAVAAGILAISRKIPLSKALREVITATSENNIKIEVISSVRKVLEEWGLEKTRNALASRQKLLITGGSGFIGQALAQELRGIMDFLAISSQDVNLLQGSSSLDLLVKEHGLTEIIHLANPRIYTANYAIGETLIFLKNVLDVCRENDLKITFLSDWEIYSGYRTSFLLASEDLPAMPKGSYGEAKYLGEQLLTQYEKNYHLKTALIRSSPVYGPGSNKPKFLYNFASKALKGETIYAHQYLNGYPSLDLLHISDFSKLLGMAIAHNFTGTLHVGGGQAISTTRVAEIIIGILGSNSYIRHRQIDEYCANIVMDITKARDLFAWEPKVSIEDGLKELF